MADEDGKEGAEKKVVHSYPLVRVSIGFKFANSVG